MAAIVSQFAEAEVPRGMFAASLRPDQPPAGVTRADGMTGVSGGGRAFPLFRLRAPCHYG
jgi:hypothetical protein